MPSAGAAAPVRRGFFNHEFDGPLSCLLLELCLLVAGCRSALSKALRVCRRFPIFHHPVWLSASPWSLLAPARLSWPSARRRLEGQG